MQVGTVTFATFGPFSRANFPPARKAAAAFRHLLRVSMLLLALCVTPSVVYADECEACTEEAREAELQEMLRLYREAVSDARKPGPFRFQCKSDPDYHDPGFSLWDRIAGDNEEPPAGNCADWARLSWGALVSRTWQCWDVIKIQARRKFWFDFHNFVYLVPKCGGRRVFLDPYVSADDPNGQNVWDENDGPFWIGNGFTGAWTFHPQAGHEAGAAGVDPGDAP